MAEEWGTQGIRFRRPILACSVDFPVSQFLDFASSVPFVAACKKVLFGWSEAAATHKSDGFLSGCITIVTWRPLTFLRSGFSLEAFSHERESSYRPADLAIDWDGIAGRVGAGEFESAG